MTDDLAKRPVLRIYTERTSEEGGIWAFKPYTSVHAVFVEESNYLDLEVRIEALTAQLESTLKDRKLILEERDRTFALMLARAQAAEAELNKAILGNHRFTEHQPTWAELTNDWKARAEAAEAERDRLREDLEELDFLRHEGGPDSVAAIEAERDRLREALTVISQFSATTSGAGNIHAIWKMTERARAALKGDTL